MKTFVGLFAVVSGFGIVIAAVYWFVAHEEAAGSALLGMMSAALAFATAYPILAEREARLEGDDPGASTENSGGADLGVFTTESPYPILIAVCTLALLAGVLWSPLLGVFGLAGTIVCLWRLGAESART